MSANFNPNIALFLGQLTNPPGSDPELHHAVGQGLENHQIVPTTLIEGFVPISSNDATNRGMRFARSETAKLDRSAAFVMRIGNPLFAAKDLDFWDIEPKKDIIFIFFVVY